MKLTRRHWTSAAAGAAGFVWAAGRSGAQTPSAIKLPQIKSTYKGVILGCNTYSMTRISLDEAIKVIAAAGLSEAELHPRHTEPVFGPPRVQGQPPPPANPEHREKLRQWRLTVPLEEFAAMGRKFRDAGVFLYSYNMNFPQDDFTDAEIDRAFEMTKALGATIMTPAAGKITTMRRLDPFAKKHRIRFAIHNENDIRTPMDFEQTMKGLSDYAAIALDIGHFVGDGSDPIEFFKKRQDLIIDCHIKDRKWHGATVPFTEGDTPIAEFLQLVRDRKFQYPVNIEYENRAVDPLVGLKASLDYCKKSLDA
jgi:sugar phosphate isomerase/epimerase